MMVHIALKLPLEPNNEQVASFARYAGTARWAFNWALGQWQAAYKAGEKQPSAYDLMKQITIIKKTEGMRWISEISRHVPDQAIFDAESAFKNFFTRLKKNLKAGFPKFKKRVNSKKSFSFNVSALPYITDRHVVVPKIGPVRIARRHFTIPDNGRALRMTISRTGNKWFASICYEIPDVPFVPNGKPSVGVDLGLTTFATLSTGEKIESPKSYRKALKTLKRQQRRLARSQRGSGRREKKRRILATTHARVRNIRQNFLHGLTAHLAKNHGKIIVEDLSVANMVRNHRLAMSIMDAGWSEFRRQLGYKCPRYGAILVVVDRFFPSSKTCNVCGLVVEYLPLAIRNWRCECGAVHDRDVNAAINLEKLGQNMPEVTRVEIGDQEKRKPLRCRSRKREVLAPKGLV